MTLVIAQQEAGRVIMGADSAAGSTDEIHTYPDLEKIFRRGPYLVGVCGSWLICQVVNYLVEWPEPPDSGDLLPFLFGEVVPEIRRAVKAADALHGAPTFLGDKTVLLVGLRGQLFIITSDLSVVRSAGLSCIGSARQYGYAAMHALKAAKIKSARRRIEMALETAAEFSNFVRPPFRILESS